MRRTIKIKTRKILISVSSFALLTAFTFFIGQRTAEVVHTTTSNIINPSGTLNWGLGFGEDGMPPTGTNTTEELKEYDAYYREDTEDKVIYLTFDAGFENGNTEPILDALKKHEVPATFFLVGNYLDTAPELVERMLEEGHEVGNHSYNHPDMSSKSMEQFTEEMNAMSEHFKEMTGQDISMYYRPPQGKYNESNLAWAQSMGYKTIFWSLAYVDWYENDQPTHDEALNKLTSRIHPGAIVLLHNTSKTNGEILDELITKWLDMGYTFKTLDEIE